MIPSLTSKDAISEQYLAFLDALKAAGFRGEVETQYSSRLAVATDNSVYQTLPQAVVFPVDTRDVVHLCHLAKLPEHRGVRFAPRGGGTGTNGQALTDGVVVDMSRHMDRILEINPYEGWVRVQAGVIKDRLNDALRPHGYFFSPDLSTSNRATLGGMINTDASGQGSLVYGKTSDHVLELTSVLIDGSVLESRPLGDAEFEEECRRGDLIGAVCRQVQATCEGKREQILAKFPPLNRFLTGYDLKHARTDRGFDISRLLCGSEGSLAFITEAKLNITPIPRYRTLVNVKYDSFESALRNARFLVQAKALSVETVDSKVLDLAKGDIVWHSVSALIADVPDKVMDGLNIVEFAEQDEAAQGIKVSALCEQLDRLIEAGEGGVIGYQVCHDLTSINRIYGMRKKAVGLLGNAEGRAKPVAFTEDTAVPPEHLADYIMEFRDLLDGYGLHYGMFGHVDAGVLHVRPALDLCDPEQELLLRKISDQVVALTAKYGGLMWGEHGKGFRSEYGPEFFGEELFSELRKIKGTFDPDNRLNPGKICTPLGSDEALVSVDGTKRGAYDRQIPVTVRDSFTEALDCNGNGLCFNYDTSSPMCPSWKLTGDRRHSPKGRAGLVREWLRQLSGLGVDPLAEEQQLLAGKTGPDSLLCRIRNTLARARGDYDFSHEVMDAMQGCLACKACTSQCPVKVDVPGFRARFMHLYYGRYLRPLKDYFVAWVESYAPLMARAPGLFNVFLRQPWVQALSGKTIGMVDIPLLSQPTLENSLAGHDALIFDVASLEQLDDETRACTVLIVQDPFTSYYDAEVVRDLILLLARLGYQPILLPFKPNGKPQHIKGFLRQFANTAATASAFLNRVARLDIPMIGVDPALVLTYRDEYRQILGERRGDFHVQLLQEWLLPRLASVPAAGTVARKTFYLFGHCTEMTALPSTDQDWQAIFAHFGQQLQSVSVGCCGMAGTYGHDATHHQDSREIYALSWQQRIAEREFESCLATGYSCRSQVKRMEGRKMKHPAQALLEVLS